MQSDCYYLFNNNTHGLENSGTIGSALMVTMAESFLQHCKENAINIGKTSIPPIQIKSFKRYVDDSHARFKNVSESERFLKIFNHPTTREHKMYKGKRKRKQIIKFSRCKHQK